MIRRLLIMLTIAAMAVACTKIDDNHTPAYQVSIRLNSVGLWNTYGVHGLGECRIFSVRKKLPANFHFTANTYTGFAGVMLLQGFDFTTQSYGVPVAFEIACPVENRYDVTVEFNSETFEAVCPKCGSHYNVLEGGGAAVSGQAFDRHYGLTRYRVYPENGGYVITN
ncbi:MAG: hypothetical protein ACI4AN_07780 [Muribaculaceae bacterium]